MPWEVAAGDGFTDETPDLLALLRCRDGDLGAGLRSRSRRQTPFTLRHIFVYRMARTERLGSRCSCSAPARAPATAVVVFHWRRCSFWGKLVRSTNITNKSSYIICKQQRMQHTCTLLPFCDNRRLEKRGQDSV